MTTTTYGTPQRPAHIQGDPTEANVRRIRAAMTTRPTNPRDVVVPRVWLTDALERIAELEAAITKVREAVA